MRFCKQMFEARIWIAGAVVGLLSLMHGNAAQAAIIQYEFIGEGHGANIGWVTDQRPVRATVTIDRSIDGELVNESLTTTDFPFAVLSMTVEVDGQTFASHPMATLPADEQNPEKRNYIRMYNYTSSFTGPATTLHIVTYGQEDVTEMSMMLIDEDDVIDSPIIPTDFTGVEEETILNVRIGGELFSARGHLQVIPEPASIMLIVGGATLCLTRGRRAA